MNLPAYAVVMKGRVCSPMLLLSLALSGGLIDSMMGERLKSERAAGADVPVKKEELAPVMHQLSLLIKTEIVNICG